jgi:hypothetical protein
MGFFDLFKKSEPGKASEKEIARLTKVVSNKLSQDLDRQDALHRLVAMGSVDAARALLRRFDWTLNPTITDQEEKALAVTGIVAAGLDVLPAIRGYCKKAESLTWAIRAIRGVVAEEDLVDELLCLLDEFDTDYARNPEPKVQLLKALAETATDEVRIATEPFLTDINEEVRFTAVDTVIAAAQDASLPSLIDALKSEESLRVKNRISVALVETQWEVSSELQTTLSEAVPPGFRVDQARLVGAPSLD